MSSKQDLYLARITTATHADYVISIVSKILLAVSLFGSLVVILLSQSPVPNEQSEIASGAFTVGSLVIFTLLYFLVKNFKSRIAAGIFVFFGVFEVFLGGGRLLGVINKNLFSFGFELGQLVFGTIISLLSLRILYATIKYPRQRS